MTRFWHIPRAFVFILIILLTPAAMGQSSQYMGVADDWLSPGAVVTWNYYPWVTQYNYPWVTPYIISVPFERMYPYEVVTSPITYPVTYPVTYPYGTTAYPYAAYYPGSTAGERWWGLQPNWTRTVEFARTQSSIRVFRGGTWVIP